MATEWVGPVSGRRYRLLTEAELSGDQPHDGRCCACGYTGHDETPCPAGDGTHCVHWWDGDDNG